MKEYIKYFNIPSYYTDITSNIYSELLSPLFKEEPIEYLRYLYRYENEVFFNVRDELILRGVSFKPQYQNNYLPSLPYNINYVLYKSHNTNAFRNINFSLMGVNNFIQRFQVNSDRFFHGIPLEGILYFTRGVSITVLKDIFKTAGFAIIPVQDFTFQKTNQEQVDNIKEEINNYSSKRKLPTLVNPPPENTSINYLFDGIDYKTFRMYCKENKVENFHQLNIDFVKKFEHRKHIRKNTAKKVFKLYNDLNKQFYNIHIEMEKTINLLLDNSFKDLMENVNYDYQKFINDFYSVNSNENYRDKYPFEKVKALEAQIINRIYENELSRSKEEFHELIIAIKEHPFFIYVEDLTLEQIENMLYLNLEIDEDENRLLIECFNDFKYYQILKIIYNQLNKLKPISVLLDTIIDQFLTRELEVLHLRQTKTLAEIGKEMDITRERVRQIESKTKEELFKYKDKIFLELYVYFYSKEKNRLISVKEFMNFYKLEGSIYNTLLHIFFEIKNKITYVKTLNLYIETDKYNYIIQVLDEIGLDSPIIHIEEIKEYFPSGEKKILMEITNLLLKTYNYQLVNNIYVKKSINIIDRIDYLFEHVIKKPLTMDEEGYLYFKKLMNSTFNVPYHSNKRSATSRIADGDNVILVDRNTFAYHNKNKITNSFLYQIETIIDERLQKHNYVDPRIIYKQYSKLMNKTEILSPSHLYSIVQIYLEDKFDTAEGNTLYIYNVNSEKLDSESVLLNYLYKHNHEADKDKTLKDLKWKNYKLDGLLTRDQSVLLTSGNKLKTIESFEFNKDDLLMLKEEVKKLMINGYMFTNDLKFELGFNKDFLPIIQKNDLLNDTTLVSVLKWLFPKLQGHSKLLYWKGNPITKLEEVIAYEYLNILTRQELVNFIESKGYSEQTTYLVTARLLEEELFYYYTNTQYINSKQLNFTENVKESLDNYLANQFKEQDYMSVYNMVGFTNEIQSISRHNWTEWLVYQFAKYVGYKQVGFTNDSRYDTLILVNESININSFDELIIHIIKTEYDSRRYHEEELAHFLEARKLINNPKSLPRVIYESEYFKFDSFGFFEIRR